MSGVGRGLMMMAFLLGAMGLFLFLYGSGGGVFAEPPVFDTTPDPTTRTIPENTPPGVNIGEPISATDPDEDDLEFGDTLTYSLGGTDAASFDIDASTGQLITKAPLDAEGTASYSVTVTVDDGVTDPSITQPVTISVTDVPGSETPLAPHPPTVVSGTDDSGTDADESTTSLKVVWHPPENAGRPSISSYAVEFKESTATSFGDTGVTVAALPATTATIMGLEADTSYDVRVRATNTDGAGLWSLVGTGSTNKEGNKAPSFNEADSLVDRDVDENTPARDDIDSPVSATDADTTTLTYGLEGPHADLFSFDTRSGQIRTKAPLNHEDPSCYVPDPDGDPGTDDSTCTYRVTVTVTDRAGGSDATGVHIEVDDRGEPPSAPARPTVRATEKSSTSLDVSWKAPENMGPPITSYVVEYRKGGESFSDDGVSITGTTATISGVDSASDDAPWLSPNTSYEVRVRAINAERTTGGEWSATGMGRTNKANHQPIFDERPHIDAEATAGVDESERNTAFTVSRRLDENPRSGQTVGARVFADDEDNDQLTYRLVASADSPEARAEAAMFAIDERTGQIRTKAGVAYNYEAIAETPTCGDLDTERIGSDRCYTVRVEVRDGLDDNRVEVKETDPDDYIIVKIAVKDLDEPPATPTVTVTAPSVTTTLEVFWDAKNTGPDITHYDLRYRKGGDSFSADNCGPTPDDDSCTRLDDDDTIGNLTTITSTTIAELVANTSYSVQMRATNAEGTSAWSRVVTVKTNKDRVDPEEANAPPTIAPPGTLTVAENTPSGRLIGTVTASDDASTPTYSLGGRDASLFTIVSSSGEIRTRGSLNHEDPACGYDSTVGTTECMYTVRVRADDGAGGSASIAVTISVTDVDEEPSKPSAPRVTATKDTGWSLDVTWNEPRDTGKPPITDYDIRYREFKPSNPDEWVLWPHGTADDATADNTDRSTKITRRLPATEADPLKPSTQYEVQVRAKNGEGDGTENWSSVGRGTTGPSNSRPSFDRTASLIELRVDENTRAGQNIGSAVSASDADSNALRYSLEGPGAESFTILPSTGQIRTKSPLDFEMRQSYSLTVKVDDGRKRDNSVATKSVTITVDNVTEQPAAPRAPRVAGIPGSTDSVRVTWDAPVNTGPAVTLYEVHYREAGAGLGYARWTHSSADRSTIITGLKAGTRYEVQVRAKSEEGTSEWSRSGTGAPNPDVANRAPTFSGGSRSLSVAENTLPNSDIGSPLAATDRDGDTLTYILEGTDADSFDVVSTSEGGQIRTSAPLNYEEKASYSVTVRVRDGRGGTDAVNVTIRVTDVNTEAPDTPFAPTVTAISSTRLQVTWDAPANTGPPITDYDYRYREPGGTWTAVTNTTITTTAVTIEGLAASTSYDVEVRAKNAEGTSDWSDPGIGSTNAPGANNPPVFSEGTSATRSVSASSPAGGSIGNPVTAIDADPGVTLRYSLEGRDAALFAIDTESGQLRTKEGVTLIAGETYTVIVAADDGIERSRITVSIEATAEPPNNPPVFAQGTSTSLSVVINARAGTNIGQPFRATDADTGDTVTYSLEGTDGASFDINGSTGQVRTKAGVTLEDKTYNVTVKAADQKGANTILAVTIEIDDRDGSVSLSPLSLQDGDQVTATLTDPDGDVTGVTWVWASSPNGTSGWTDISGATSATYTAATTDVGRHLRATASYTDAVGPGKSASAVTVAAVAADDDGSVTLSPSSLSDGETVTATLSDPDGGVTGVTWQWEFSRDRSNWTIIFGVTSSSYTATTANVGSYLRATASYTDAVGPNKSAEGVTAGVVTADDDGSVTLSNTTPTAGETVTATLNDPDGGETGVTWRWELSRDRSSWTIIPGATSSSYTATTANVGSYLRASVSYTDAVGPGKSANAVTAAAVAPDDDGVVTLSTRAPEVGSAITASLSDPDGGVTGETWQWAKSSNGATGWTDIQGATSASYTPGRSDTGVFLRATVSYNDAVGPGKSAQAATSSGVAQAALLSDYDSNRDGRIERSEAIQAVSDFFNGEISKGDVLDVLVLYFSS